MVPGIEFTGYHQHTTKNKHDSLSSEQLSELPCIELVSPGAKCPQAQYSGQVDMYTVGTITTRHQALLVLEVPGSWDPTCTPLRHIFISVVDYFYRFLFVLQWCLVLVLREITPSRRFSLGTYDTDISAKHESTSGPSHLPEFPVAPGVLSHGCWF
jgi:hypothetical protein